MTAGLLTAELVHLFHPPLLAVAIIVRLHAHHRTRARAQLEMLLRQQGVRTRQEQLRSRRWRRRRRGSRAFASSVPPQRLVCGYLLVVDLLEHQGGRSSYSGRQCEDEHEQ